MIIVLKRGLDKKTIEDFSIVPGALRGLNETFSHPNRIVHFCNDNKLLKKILDS